MSSYVRNEMWNDIPGIGKLFLEESLVFANEPVLFVCFDKAGNERYLVMTYDYYDSEFVISKITPEVLCKMLKNEITLYDAFKNSSYIYKTSLNNDFLDCERYLSNNFNDELLPQKGTFFELKGAYIDRYIMMLEKVPQQITEYVLPISSEIKKMNMDYKMNYDEEKNILLKSSFNNANFSYINSVA